MAEWSLSPASVEAAAVVLQAALTTAVIAVAIWSPRLQQLEVMRSRKPFVCFVGGQTHEGYTEVIYRNYGESPATNVGITPFIIQSKTGSVEETAKVVYRQPLAPNMYGTVHFECGLDPTSWYVLAYSYADISDKHVASGHAYFKGRFRVNDPKSWTYRELEMLSRSEEDSAVRFLEHHHGIANGASIAAGSMRSEAAEASAS